VVNVALPAITRDLKGGLAGQQWVVDAYLISLGSLILVAGSISDLFGRKKILISGLIGFGVTSILCALAPSDIFLIIARGLQGISGALLVPSSLALIISTFSGAAQSKAIGKWTAWTGIAFIVGPLLGGLLVQTISWRLIFAINIIPIVITLWLIRYIKVPERVDQIIKIDIPGAVLCALGLAFTLGVIMLSSFIVYEHRAKSPMLPLDIFKVRNFLFGNIATTAIYAGLSVATFLIVIYIQQVGGYSAINAGLSLIPVTIIMFLLSPRFGALSAKIGPRILMTCGPIIAGIGFLLLLRVGQSIDYWTRLFPGIFVFGLGLSMTVAPLTSAVLGAVKSSQAGISSAINNAVSRIAGLIGIAFLGLIVGQKLNIHGFHHGVIAMAILLYVGGFISFVGIRNPSKIKG
jgi:MFS family permease